MYRLLSRLQLMSNILFSPLAQISPGCGSGPRKCLLSTHSSSNGTEKTWGALQEAYCGGRQFLLGPHSGWTWRCWWIQPVVVAFILKEKKSI